MSETPAERQRVPARLVLASIIGLWATYFLLTTLRGHLLGYEFNWAFVSRRMTVSVASIAVTAALWPLFVALSRRPFWQRVGVMMVVGLPAAFLLTAINSWVFADLDHEAKLREQNQSVNILDDGDGNIVELGNGRLKVRSDDGSVVELNNGRLIVREGKGADGSPAVPAPPAPPPPLPVASAGPPSPPAPPSVPTTAAREKTVPVRAAPQKSDFWEEYADMTLTRYFLLIAWMALYLALESAQRAGAAERREGEFRRAAQAAELRSLRYQINPHFLFNTLNSLSALVLTGKQAAAEQMIQTLSTFYRRSLTGNSTGDVMLEEEIGLQRLYLEIEAVRFPERLRTVISVPEALARAQVPGMILQPLVENSIKYAVAVSKQPVTVTIAARSEGQSLVLSVSDDGPGGPGAAQDGCGIGLKNVSDRLHARFDGAASLEAGPQLEGGFSTVIRLPLERSLEYGDA